MVGHGLLTVPILLVQIPVLSGEPVLGTFFILLCFSSESPVLWRLCQMLKKPHPKQGLLRMGFINTGRTGSYGVFVAVAVGVTVLVGAVPTTMMTHR